MFSHYSLCVGLYVVVLKFCIRETWLYAKFNVCYRILPLFLVQFVARLGILFISSPGISSPIHVAFPEFVSIFRCTEVIRNFVEYIIDIGGARIPTI